MLGYVLWHHPAAGVDASVYEEALRTFHSTLTGSAAYAFHDVPWFPNPSGYLDWYTVADFASLGVLNEAAVTRARKDPHDQAARLTGAGFGGVYGLISGRAVFPEAAVGTWLKKPAGMSYQDFGAQ